MANNRRQCLVHLDTSALIRATGPDSVEGSKINFHVDQSQCESGISTVTLSEFLSGPDIDTAAIGAMAEQIGGQYQVIPLDARVSIVAAKIFKILHRSGQTRKLSKGERAVLKADVFILATAVVEGADEFITADNDFKSYYEILKKDSFEHHLPQLSLAKDLPDVIEQQELPV